MVLDDVLPKAFVMVTKTFVPAAYVATGFPLVSVNRNDSEALVMPGGTAVWAIMVVPPMLTLLLTVPPAMTFT